MNMHLFPLSHHPDYFDRAISLIELSFGYHPKYSFKADFLPLTHQSNWEHLFFSLGEQKEVVATGGYRALKLGPYNVAFIGAIATTPTRRGQGLGREMMSALLEKVRHFDLVLLWSEKSAFYAQFGFNEFGFLFENQGKSWSEHSQAKSLKRLTHKEQEHIRCCYESYYHSLLTPTRSELDWEIIFQMESVSCSLFDWGYVFADKGMDLGGIIHEAASMPGHEAELSLTLKDYHYWLRGPELRGDQNRFAGLIKVQTNDVIPLDELERIFIPGVDAI